MRQEFFMEDEASHAMENFNNMPMIDIVEIDIYQLEPNFCKTI